MTYLCVYNDFPFSNRPFNSSEKIFIQPNAIILASLFYCRPPRPGISVQPSKIVESSVRVRVYMCVAAIACRVTPVQRETSVKSIWRIYIAFSARYPRATIQSFPILSRRGCGAGWLVFNITSRFRVCDCVESAHAGENRIFGEWAVFEIYF